MAPLRWGIIGAGKICYDFCLAVKTLDDRMHCLTAIAARSRENAERFAKTFDIERFYGTYEELVTDPMVDVVYIGTINITHKYLAIMAMKNGKHVLCEKPATIDADDLEEILKTAKEMKMFFMEAMWTRLMPIYIDVQNAIKDGLIGDVQAAMVTLGIDHLKSVERVTDPKLGGSVLLDIGVYAVNFADMAFTGMMPNHITACGFSSRCGVDLTSSVTFMYNSKSLAQFLVSGEMSLPNEGIIIGTKGKIIIEAPFWCPTMIHINGNSKQYELPKTAFPTNFTNSAALRFEAEHVRECLEQNKLESDVMCHDTSRRMIGLLDQIRKQI